MSLKDRFSEATKHTTSDLNSIAQSPRLRELSELSLPEIEKVVNLIAAIAPAGNVPGMILNGLARISNRKAPIANVRRDIDALFKGVEQTLDKAVYATFFAGPAAVIWAYQNMLKLVGKSLDDSFPEGTWQFYVDYALREDTARHSHETHGFYTVLRENKLRISQTDRITAWVMAAIHTLHDYDELLKNEWRERIYTSLLESVVSQTAEKQRYAELYREWEKQRPYKLEEEKYGTYAVYRRAAFDRFLDKSLQELPLELRHQWLKQVKTSEAKSLAAYQRQLSILAYLVPDAYGETRTPIPLEKIHIGLIYQGRYYLIPVCMPDTNQPADITHVRGQVAAMLKYPSQAQTASLIPLIRVKRASLPGLYKKLNPEAVEQLKLLRLTPILLNCDLRSRQLALSDLRQTERGIGDHALTIFDTGETHVFDQSHIFFDGAWGAALAEIMTNEAISWANRLHDLPPAEPGDKRPYRVKIVLREGELQLIQEVPQVTAEEGAETDKVNLRKIQRLRKILQRRNDLLVLTVNDILVLYRAIHAAVYRPSDYLVAELKALARKKETGSAALAMFNAINNTYMTDPAILIPTDASRHSPRDRLYPMNIQVPLYDLDLLDLHDRVLAALDAYESNKGSYDDFDHLQRTYLATLAGFGAVMKRAKEIANESQTAATIKLLAHLPIPLQRLLDQIPGRFDVLNDIIKGREVFSNVGAVAASSTLTRFTTAKDDNDKKTLAWGILTDAQGVMRITLRDFRPHVAALKAIGRKDLAVAITQEYVDTYAQGLNAYIRDLTRIALATPDTIPFKSDIT